MHEQLRTAAVDQSHQEKRWNERVKRKINKRQKQNCCSLYRQIRACHAAAGNIPGRRPCPPGQHIIARAQLYHRQPSDRGSIVAPPRPRPRSCVRGAPWQWPVASRMGESDDARQRQHRHGMGGWEMRGMRSLPALDARPNYPNYRHLAVGIRLPSLRRIWGVLASVATVLDPQLLVDRF